MGSFDSFQVLYADGAPAAPIRIGQLLVNEALPGAPLQQCTSLSPLTYTTVGGGQLIMRGAAFVSSSALVNPVAPVSLYFPRAATIKRVVILGDLLGSVTVGIAKQALSAFAGGGGANICGTDLPTISSGYQSDKTTFTGWTLGVAVDDVLTISLATVSLFKRVTVQIFFE